VGRTKLSVVELDHGVQISRWCSAVATPAPELLELDAARPRTKALTMQVKHNVRKATKIVSPIMYNATLDR